MSLLDSLSRPRTLAVLLAISLAINLFLAGTMAGRFSARERGGAYPGPLLGLGAPGFESGFRFIPREGREHLREALHQRRPELRDEHKALARLHRQIAAELRRDAPDRALVESKFREIRAKTQTIEESMQAALLDAALAMGPPERRAMLDAMLENRTHPPHQGPPPGAPGGGPPPFEQALPPPEAQAGGFEPPLPPPPGPDGEPAPLE